MQLDLLLLILFRQRFEINEFLEIHINFSQLVSLFHLMNVIQFEFDIRACHYLVLIAPIHLIMSKVFNFIGEYSVCLCNFITL